MSLVALCLVPSACKAKPVVALDAAASDAATSTVDAAAGDAGARPGFQHYPDAALRFVSKTWRRRRLDVALGGNPQWAEFSPDDQRVIVGMSGTAVVSPDHKRLAVKDVDSATFSPDGSRVALVTLNGDTATDIVVVAMPDLKVMTKVTAATFLSWLDAGTILFAKDGYLWRQSIVAGATPERIGSEKRLYSCLDWATYRTSDNCARPERIEVSRDLTRAIVVQLGTDSVADVRRVDLRDGSSRSLFAGKTLPCVDHREVTSCRFSFVAADADADVACAWTVPASSSKPAISCARGEDAVEDVATFDRYPTAGALSLHRGGKMLRFAAPDEKRSGSDGIGLVDFDARGWWRATGPEDPSQARINVAEQTWWSLPGGPNGAEGWALGTSQHGALVIGHEEGRSTRLEIVEPE